MPSPMVLMMFVSTARPIRKLAAMQGAPLGAWVEIRPAYPRMPSDILVEYWPEWMRVGDANWQPAAR